MDLNLEIQVATDKFIAEKLPQFVEEKVSKMVDGILEDVFRGYGETAKAIKSKIEEKLDINLQKFDTIDYNALVAKTINDNLLQQVNLQPILDLTQNIVGFVNKKEISLYDISQFFIEASQEEHDQDGEGEITFIVEENENYKWIEVNADIDADKEKHECSVRFIFSIEKDRGTIFSFRTKDKYYEDNQREVSPSRLVNMSNIEAKIFRLYSAQVKITNYDQQPSIYWDRY